MGSLIILKEEKTELKWFRQILIIIMMLTLIAALVYGSILHLRHARAEKILSDFTDALEESSYDKVIQLYRQVRQRALSDDPLDPNRQHYRDALEQMEQMTDEILQGIEQKLGNGVLLTKEEIGLVGGLAELSAARMITCLRAIARDFLFARVDRPVVEQAFAQIASLDNISQGVAGLSGEFNQMAELRSDVARTVTQIDNGRYWEAWAGCEALLAQEELGPFTREQLLVHMTNCRETMYQPLLDEALLLLEGGRYLSAEKALSALLAVYPGETAIRAALDACTPYLPEKLVPYQGAIEFIAIKPLINNPEIAFSGGPYSAAADDTMLTVGEFSAMIRALYANDFILVDGDALYDERRNLLTLQLPPGKKPLVLVLEGLNYYITRRETGNAWNLVLDEGGEVAAEYLDASGQLTVGRNGEAIGILDQFVADHPDFALDGAKATISLTGYECVFGYITDRDQVDDRNEALQQHGMAPLSLSDADIAANRMAAREIMERLQATGWRFASSTYGFINARDHDMERIRTDTEKWLAQVGSLTGPVTMLHYPNGAFISGSDERAEYLKDQGFILFGGIGPTAYLFRGDRYIYVDKVPINGFTLRNSRTYGLERFFDAASVYDAAARGR